MVLFGFPFYSVCNFGNFELGTVKVNYNITAGHQKAILCMNVNAACIQWYTPTVICFVMSQLSRFLILILFLVTNEIFEGFTKVQNYGICLDRVFDIRAFYNTQLS